MPPFPSNFRNILENVSKILANCFLVLSFLFLRIHWNVRNSVLFSWVANLCKLIIPKKWNIDEQMQHLLSLLKLGKLSWFECMQKMCTCSEKRKMKKKYLNSYQKWSRDNSVEVVERFRMMSLLHKSLIQPETSLGKDPKMGRPVNVFDGDNGATYHCPSNT